jgi:catechol 2,3-dioxygenase-like lactoylglutathione lyase family enzyme
MKSRLFLSNAHNRHQAPCALVRNTRKTVAAAIEARTTPQPGGARGALPEDPRSSFAVWWRASAPFALLIAVIAATTVKAQSVTRPKIIGVAHISLFAHDFEASRAFYRDMLGFEEPYSLKNADGSTSMTFFKVNERQYIELAPEKNPAVARFNHFAIEVEDAEAMRLYLKSRGVVVPDHVPTGRIGNLNFMIKDPQGVNVEIVQYGASSWTLKAKGKYLSDRRISSRIMHVGFVVTDIQAELRFYEDVLGFHEFWRGSKDGVTLSWINLKLPDSYDYVELMLYSAVPGRKARGTADHLCLEVPNADHALGLLKQRAAEAKYGRPIELRTGKNGKRQINLYDPDETRTEVMEPHTASGKPAPSSTAPLPAAADK